MKAYKAKYSFVIVSIMIPGLYLTDCDCFGFLLSQLNRFGGALLIKMVTQNMNKSWKNTSMSPLGLRTYMLL